MKKYYLFFLLVLLLSLTILPASMAGQVVDGVYYSDEAFEKRQLLLNLHEEINSPTYEQEASEVFTGYGRVVDLNDNPVVNANIKVQWWRNEVVKGFGIKIHTDKEWVSTDQNGYFTVTTLNGAIPTLYGVEARGYEEKWNLTPYANAENDQESMMKNSEVEPIILYMRKLNPTTFLLKNETGYYFKEAITHMRFTLNQGLLRKIDPDLTKLRKPEQNDLIFTVTKNADSSFTMHIQSVPTIGGSMQILDDYLYEAPVGGYSQESIITIRPEDGKIKKYLYFISRQPSVYSRMTMSLHVWDDRKLSFGGNIWTNPYGKRNLEWEPELPFDLEEKLEKEAENGLKSGTLPSEPVDLQLLIDQCITE